ncbi:MAG: hypothetical protein WCZ47_04825 [Bacilli bacterium]|jgi:hypothetical protein|nr:hypothetical protein [Bacilli bacterium]
MPPGLKITIIIVASLIGLYLLFFLLVLFVISTFKKRLGKRQLALHLILQQRKDIIVNMYALALKEKIDFEKQLKSAIKKLQKDEERHIHEHDILLELSRIEKLSLDLINFLKTQRSFKKKEEFILFQKELEELDELKRQHISIYNHDVEGYNYWVRFLTYRYLFVLFKVETKKRLE